MIHSSDHLLGWLESPFGSSLVFEVLAATHIEQRVLALSWLMRGNMLLGSGEFGRFGTKPLFVLGFGARHHVVHHFLFFLIFLCLETKLLLGFWGFGVLGRDG